MWKMFDDNIECDKCGSPGPPPKFVIPPPPRFPSLQEFTKNCNEDSDILNNYNWDSDMCDAIPLLDASFHKSQSLQTSAIIAVFSLMLLLVILLSSLFVWKNKRKAPNCLPCKTPSRVPHMNGGGPGAGHSLACEDPDAHLGHRPLVIRHHNVELLHSKSIHYPSGYPMTRSPPFLVSSSPGPDPYRSNENVYEELGPVPDSDFENEPPLHSDDDFAEDELSLPGERSFNKSVSEITTSIGVSTIYHERIPTLRGTEHERNSLLSTSSSSNQNDATTKVALASISSASAAASNHNRHNAGGILSGALRHTTGRRLNIRNKKNNNINEASISTDDFSTSSDHTASSDMTIAMSNYSIDRNYHNAIRNSQQHYYNTLDNHVERQNQINNELSQPGSAVSTIFRERINYAGSGPFPQPYYMTTNRGNSLLKSVRSEINARRADRRHIVPLLNPIEPAYGYVEPIFHEGYLYDSCSHTNRLNSTVGAKTSYILPDYASSYRTNNRNQQLSHHFGNFNSLATPQPCLQSTAHQLKNHPSSLLQTQQQQAIYSRKSSFGSDSGYSNHTSSVRSGVCTPTMPNQNHQPSTLKSNNPDQKVKNGHINTGNQQRTGLSFILNQKNQKDNNITTMTLKPASSLPPFDTKNDTSNSQNNNHFVNEDSTSSPVNIATNSNSNNNNTVEIAATA